MLNIRKYAWLKYWNSQLPVTLIWGQILANKPPCCSSCENKGYRRKIVPSDCNVGYCVMYSIQFKGRFMVWWKFFLLMVTCSGNCLGLARSWFACRSLYRHTKCTRAISHHIASQSHINCNTSKAKYDILELIELWNTYRVIILHNSNLLLT